MSFLLWLYFFLSCPLLAASLLTGPAVLVRLRSKRAFEFVFLCFYFPELVGCATLVMFCCRRSVDDDASWWWCWMECLHSFPELYFRGMEAFVMDFLTDCLFAPLTKNKSMGTQTGTMYFSLKLLASVTISVILFDLCRIYHRLFFMEFGCAFLHYPLKLGDFASIPVT